MRGPGDVRSAATASTAHAITSASSKKFAAPSGTRSAITPATPIAAPRHITVDEAIPSTPRHPRIKPVTPSTSSPTPSTKPSTRIVASGHRISIKPTTTRRMVLATTVLRESVRLTWNERPVTYVVTATAIATTPRIVAVVSGSRSGQARTTRTTAPRAIATRRRARSCSVHTRDSALGPCRSGVSSSKSSVSTSPSVAQRRTSMVGLQIPVGLTTT